MIKERVKCEAIPRIHRISSYDAFVMIEDNDDNTISLCKKEMQDNKYAYYIQYHNDGNVNLWYCKLNETFNILRETVDVYVAKNVSVNCEVEYERGLRN